VAAGRRDAVVIGQAIGSRDVEMLALAYEGLALVSDRLVAEGMGRLDESATAAISGELRGVDEAGTIACCLIAACERVRDVGRAAEWCLRLRELSERWAFELMIAVCRTHCGSTLVARGQWREAEREFQAAIGGFGHPTAARRPRRRSGRPSFASARAGSTRRRSCWTGSTPDPLA
jgi:hypothetical protein